MHPQLARDCSVACLTLVIVIHYTVRSFITYNHCCRNHHYEISVAQKVVYRARSVFEFVQLHGCFLPSAFVRCIFRMFIYSEGLD